MQNIGANTLHTLNASQPELFQRLLRCATSGDSLLLIENGVYIIANKHALHAANSLGIRLYCLQVDVCARGLQRWLSSGKDASVMLEISTITDADFVELSCVHSKVVSWFL